MKEKIIINYLLIGLFFLACTCNSFSQENEVPITSNSEKAVKLFKEGRIFFENFENAKSIEKFDMALKIDPDMVIAYLYKSIVVWNYEEKTSNMNEALKRIDNVSEGEKFLVLANKAFNDANDGEMWKYLDQLLNLYPYDKRVNLLAGSFNLNKDKYDIAISYYKKALNFDNHFAPAYNSLGYAYLKLQQFDDAERSFKKYIEILPDKANPYDSYANFLLSLDRYDEAIAQLKIALEKDEVFYFSLRKVGDIYILKKDFKLARDSYQKYYDNSKELGQKFNALYNIANTYLFEGEKESAIKTYNKYKELAIKNNSPFYEIQALNYQGLIYTCCGDPAKGLDLYKKANHLIETADLDENKRYELKLADAYWKGHAYIELNDMENANKEIDRCSMLAEKLENSYINKKIELLEIYKYIKKGDYNLALNKIEKLELEEPLFYYYYALALELKGDFEQAKKYYALLLDEKNVTMSAALYYKKAEQKLAN